MSVNFQEIVLGGYFHPYDRDLSGYLYREFRKAEKEYYDAPDFFAGCFQVIKELKILYNKKIKERVNIIQVYLKQFSEVDSVQTIAYTKELAEIDLGLFRVELNSLERGNYPYAISHDQISYIQKAIEQAYKRAYQPSEEDILKAKNQKLEPLEYLKASWSYLFWALTDFDDMASPMVVYNSLYDIIQKLKPLRALYWETENFLEEAIKQIAIPKTIIIDFLLKATTDDDTYCYAYNSLADMANWEYIFPYDLKEIAEQDLLDMIAAENIQKIEDTNDLFSATTLKKTGSPIEKLTLPQIALKFAWEGKNISKQNSLEIAKNHGYESGSKLLQIYSKFMKKSERIADPDRSVTIMKNKIKLFESVIEMLSQAYKSNALEELNILRKIFEKTYLKKDV